MTKPGLTVYRAADTTTLADAWVVSLTGPVADPFAQPLVLTDGPGVQRWLSQRFSSHPTSSGICAGLDFRWFSQLLPLLEKLPPHDDPWSVSRLTWAIIDLVESGGDDALQPLIHHLSTCHEPVGAAHRVAQLVARYIEHRPSMLASWSHTTTLTDLDLGFDQWQPALWRHLQHVIDQPDPVTRRTALARSVISGEYSFDWPVLSVFNPLRVSPAQAELLQTLATHHRVDVWLATVDNNSRHELKTRLSERRSTTASVLTALAGHVVDLGSAPRPTTVLGQLQADLVSNVASVTAVDVMDDSVRIHASHGLHRQVEVLREALVAAFADDPSLEPRDVVVLTPRPHELAPHVDALFGRIEETDDSWRHPGRDLRLQVVNDAADRTNEAYHVVRTVMGLWRSRATSQDLVDLCAHPWVARRFGFEDEQLNRLVELVKASAIRWGINAAHRADFGLDLIPQGTWLSGVQRLIVGEALSDEQRDSVGLIAPVGDVESADLDLIGAFAELVSRVSRLAQRCSTPTTLQQWVDRWTAIVDQLVDVDSEHTWQLNQIWSVFDQLREQSTTNQVDINLRDASALLDAEFKARSARPAFGNGSLVTASLSALATVPHRVVAIVGLDERSFPRRGRPDGDDMLRRHPEPGDPDIGADDRQALFDAIMSAQDRLIVVYQGHSSLTHEEFPPPSGLVDLIETVQAMTGANPVVNEALQPFAAEYFQADQPRSFDQHSCAAAHSAVKPRHRAADIFSLSKLPSTDPRDSLTLADMVSFFAHPAKFFWRHRVGVWFGEDEPLNEKLPIDLNALQQWQIGDRLVRGLLRGLPMDQVAHQEWMLGALPPGTLGGRVLNRIVPEAAAVAEAHENLTTGQRVSTLIDLTISGVHLTGNVATYDNVIVHTGYSSVGAKQLMATWIELLALTATTQSHVDAVVVGKRGQMWLTGPHPHQAEQFLATLIDIVMEGFTRVLPLPPRAAYQWAELRARGQDPATDENLKWGFDHDDLWGRYWSHYQVPSEPSPRPWPVYGESTELGALAVLAYGPMVSALGGSR